MLCRSRAGITAYMGILIALTVLLSVIEGMIPVSYAVPGMRLGIANIVVLFTLEYMGEAYCGVIICAKSLLALITRGMSAFIMSLCGGLVSFAAMSLIYVLIYKKHNDKISPISVSVVGGVFHNVGQLLAAMLLMGSSAVLYYIPYIIIGGVVSGLVTGILYIYTICGINSVRRSKQK